MPPSTPKHPEAKNNPSQGASTQTVSPEKPEGDRPETRQAPSDLQWQRQTAKSPDDFE